MVKTILSASPRLLQVTWPEELVVQSRAPKRKTQIRSAVPAVAIHPRKNVIQESQRYHLIGPLRFDSSDAKLCSLHVSAPNRSELVAVGDSPINRLANDESAEGTLGPSDYRCVRAFGFIWLHALTCCKALYVRKSLPWNSSDHACPICSTTRWPLTQQTVM